jgi:hypothetical protein
VDEPGPGTIGAMGDGPAATVAMSRATWAAVVVRVCGRCGVVGGLVRVVGGSNSDVGGPSRVVGGWDRSGVAGTAAWAAGTAAGAAGTAAGAAGPQRGRPGPQRGRPGPRPTGTVPTVLLSRGRRRTWSVVSRRRLMVWRAVSDSSSPAPGGRLGRPVARGRTRSRNRRWVCIRRRVKR